MSKEFEEIRMALTDVKLVIRVMGDDDIEDECNGCGRKKEVRVFESEDDDPESFFSFRLCKECSKEIISEQMFTVAWGGERPSDTIHWGEAPDFDSVATSTEDLIEKLTKKDHIFTKKLSSFLNGDVQLDDGTEHPLLASIAKQVQEKMKLPTDPQLIAFKAVYDNLMGKKRAGEALILETLEDKEKRRKASLKLLDLSNRNIEKFTGKTKEIIRSMTAQYNSKKILSVKQVKFLRYIVEQLPPACLVELVEKEL